MKLTTQTKIYLGMLAVAAIAFVADRSFFSSNAVAAKPAVSRKSIAPSQARIQSSGPAEVGESDELLDLSSFSQRLETAAKKDKLDEMKDPFAPPSA